MKKKDFRGRRIIVFCLGVLLMFLFGGCAKKYNVDYCGDRKWYKGAKDSYAAGTKVSLRYDLIATDTNYSFYLDDEPLQYRFQNEVFLIEFTMPDHDVVLRCESYNSMEYEPEDGIRQEDGAEPDGAAETETGTETSGF